MRTSSVFIDSNVIVRYFAGDTAAKKILDPVIYGEVEGYINSIVYSEVIYITMKLITGKKAYELKEDPDAVKNAIRKLRDQIEFLRTFFKELEINDKIKQLSVEIIEQYGLLPNDALIAASCKHYSIGTILTFDEDFKRIPWLRTIP